MTSTSTITVLELIGMDATRILLIEDDSDLLEELKELLVSKGHQVESVRTQFQFNRIPDIRVFDIFVVDLTLPDCDGMDIIKLIRAQSDMGIIVLSGKTDQTHKVVALEMGADDYVEKPMSSLEFVARIRRLLRRFERTPTTVQSGDTTNVLKYDKWSTNLATRTVHNANGESIILTKLEFDLWIAFLKNRGVALSRERLIYILRGQSWAGSDRSIDGLVSRLRVKLNAGDNHVELKTVHGIGYCLEELP